MKRSFHGRSLKSQFAAFIFHYNQLHCNGRGKARVSVLFFAFCLVSLLYSAVSQAQTLSSLALSPTSVNGGVSSTGTVTLGSNAPAGGAVVNLSSNNAAATVPASVTVASGTNSKTFTVTTSLVATNQNVTITASKSGSSNKTKTLTVKAPVPTSLTLSEQYIQGGNGNTSEGTVTMNLAAPVGGINVALSSNNVVAIVPPTVTIPQGETSATFTVNTTPSKDSVTARISAAYSGTTKNANLYIDSLGSPYISLLDGDGKLGLEFFHTSNVDSYKIKRSTVDGGPYTVVGTLQAIDIVNSEAVYVDNGLTNGTTYYYVVSRVDDGVEGYDSNQVSGEPQAISAPTGLTTTSMRGAVVLNWTNPTGPGMARILRGTAPGGPYSTFVGSTGGETYSDKSAIPGTTYYYVVQWAMGVDAANSNESSGSVLPSGITLQGGYSSEGYVALSWFNSTPFPNGYYKVQRSTTPGGPYTTITTFPLQSPPGYTVVHTYLYGGTATDTTALLGTTYYYIIEGVYYPDWDTTGSSNPYPITASNEVSGQRIEVTPPGSPSFSDVGSDRVTVTAPALPAWATHLSLQQKLQSEPDGSYSTIANNLSGSAVTVANNLTSKTAYSFRYVAHSSFATVNGSGANVTTKITIPGELTVVDVTGTTVKLKMPSLPGDATSLILERLVETAPGSTSPPTSNMIGWYQADSLTSLGNTLVTQWPDSSAAGQHASQQSVDRQPLLVHNAVNGRSIVRFNGTEDLHGNGDFLRMPAGKRNFTNGYSAFAVVKPVNDAGNMAIVDLSNGFNPYSYIRFTRNGLYFGVIPSTGKMHYGIGNSDIWGAGSLEGSGVTSSNFQIVSAVQDGGPILVPSNVNLYRNGSRIASGNVPVPEIVERVTNFIGSPSDNQGHAPFKGDIAEVLLYDSALSNANRKQVEEYLSRKYAIGAANAPTGTWVTIATGLAGQAIYDDTLLTPETTYWYRTRSTDGVETSEPGPVEMATTLPAAPDAPAAPTFGVETAYTIPVIAPALPARATHMRLQYKPDGGTYADMADNIKGGATFLARGLRPGQLYYFRFVAVGRGGETNGAEASHSTALTDVSGNGTGLRGFYYAFVTGHEFKMLELVRVDPTIDFQWASGSPDPGMQNSFCVRWLGQVEAQVTGTHTIYFKNGSLDKVKLWVNGQLLIDYAGGGAAEHSGTIALTAGQKYDIAIEYVDYGNGAPDEGYAELRWSCDAAALTKQIIPQSQLYPLMLPDAPGAPVIEDVSATSILVAQPAWPANTSSLSLQMKEARYADDAYITVASGLLPGEKTTISDLIPQKEYTLRYVAQGFGAGVTANGATVNVWTYPNWPGVPFPPTFLNRSDTTVTVKAPELPPNAQTMTLQRSTGDQLNYVDVEQGLLDNSTTQATGLTLGTLYYFRYVAVNPYGQTPGEGRAIKTVISPGVPPAPVFESVGENSAVVNYIPFPTNTSQLRLEKKKAGEPDSAYAAVFTLSSEVTGTREVTGLEAGTEYLFRYVAIGSGSDGFVAPTTPGPATTVNTTPGAPTAPEPPEVPAFSNIARNSLTVTTPELPLRAVSLTLQKKLSSELDTAYTDVETNLQGEQEVEVDGLTAGTSYHFRCVAVNAEGSTIGLAASVTTGDSPPGALGPPTFSTPVYNGVLTASVIVTPPSFPALTSSLNLEMKEFGESDTEYQVVDNQILPGQTSLVSGLYNGKTYTFRYVAYGIGGNTPGTPANLTISALTSLWEVGTPIACEGIATPDQNITVAQDAEVPLSSAPAHDWDLRVWKLGGVTLGTTRLADPCKYLWSATGGSFKASRVKGQSVTWVAPAVPGTYVITLTVDDQNTLNIGTGETGSRNDDPALTFTRTIIVD